MSTSTFALAQQRLEARRQATAGASQHSAQFAEPPSTPTRSFLALSPSLQNLAHAAATATASASNRWWTSTTRPSPRVSQLDASLLDDELLSLLQSRVADATRFFGHHLADDWSAEISLLLKALLFKISLWDGDGSYGAALQGLRLVDARTHDAAGNMSLKSLGKWKRGVYGLLTVGSGYAWEKWEDWLTAHSGGRDATKWRALVQWAEFAGNAHAVATLLSFLVFLVNGRYRSLLDRMLGVRLVPSTSRMDRQVSFEYLNRQLVWNAFTEFFLFILPLIGVRKWRKWASRALKTLMSLGKSSEEQILETGEFAHLPEQTCAICYQDQDLGEGSDAFTRIQGASSIISSAQTDITNPYETTPCACVYCFVCLVRRLEAEDGDLWTCLRCGKGVSSCRPWRGDVLDEEETMDESQTPVEKEADT